MFLLGLVSCREDATNNASKNTESAKASKKKSACDCFKHVDDPKEFINTVKKDSPCGWLGDKNISKEAIKEINDSMLKNCPDLHKKVFATQVSVKNSNNDCGSFRIEYENNIETLCEGDGCDCRDDEGFVINGTY